MAAREKQYVITMAFRMACFISIFFVDGWLRWVVLAGAIFLPFFAVLFANQADTKSEPSTMKHGEPAPAAQLTAGAPPEEVIEGELAEDEDERTRDDEDEGWTRRERVA
jgi:hypothetical protein